LNYDFSGVDAAKNDKDMYGIRYAEFVVPLVKAVQELSKTNDDKDARIDALQKQNADLEKRMEKLEAMMSALQLSANNNGQTVKPNNLSLEQNIPNPFNNSTTINYTLPLQYSKAKIVITDDRGKTIKQINISGTGKGSVKIDASLLAGAAYSYTLYVNDKMVDSKKMVLAR
jgi:trimeric autotransporter adhesin